MTSRSKEYGYRDVIMLLAAKTAACNFKDNIEVLSKINTNWTEAYADDLIVRIDEVLNENLGIDAKKDLRNATAKLKVLMTQVRKDLKSFKLMVITLYKGKPEAKGEILRVLGFKQNKNALSRASQSGLITLLFTFKTNLLPPLRQELKEKGFNESLIDSIIANAGPLESLNNAQELQKGNSAEISYNKKTLYNAIYREISTICINSASHFSDSPAKKSLFIFSKLAGAAAKKQKAIEESLNDDKKDGSNSANNNSSNPSTP